jgi:hypothetical protein
LTIMTRLLFVAAAAIVFAWDGASPSRAHDFEAPRVTVELSERVAGGHPDLRTTIELDASAPFDGVVVVAPPGSGIAEDAEIPDGSVVGRLDGEATTNAITREACDLRSTFSVPIVEATADVASPDYPAYLREVAPGRHRLRLLADVSPSPQIPVVIHYLFDVDPLAGAVVSRTVIGNPLEPPAQFRTCTPLKSVNTLWGVAANGAPLLTAADPLPEPQVPFRFTFTSRADADGHRHEQQVEAVARVAEVEGRPLPEPSPVALSAPADLRLTTTGNVAQLEWSYDGAVDGFVIERLEQFNEGDGHSILQRFSLGGGARTFELSADLLPPSCASGSVRYRIAAVRADIQGAFAEIGPLTACDGELRPRAGVRPPDAGSGRRGGDGVPMSAPWLALCGAVLLAVGLLARRAR